MSAYATPAPDDPPMIDYDGEVVRGRFPRLDLAALLRGERHDRSWIVHGLIPEGCCVSLVAPPGSGKSLVGLDLGVRVATGHSHFANLTIPRKRRVLLVDMENTEDDLRERLHDLGVKPTDDLNNLVFLHLPPLPPLDWPVGGAELAAILDAYAVVQGDLVILDSTQRVTAGKEDASDTFRALYNHTGLMLKQRGVAVLRTDNTGKDRGRGARGSSGKADDVDAELLVVSEPADAKRGLLRIVPGKVRFPGINPLTLHRVVDDDGMVRHTTEGDTYRAEVTAAALALDRFHVPLEAGERPALEALRKGGVGVTRAVLRQAIKERRDAPRGAPKNLGAPPSLERARDLRRQTSAQIGAHPTEGA